MHKALTIALLLGTWACSRDERAVVQPTEPATAAAAIETPTAAAPPQPRAVPGIDMETLTGRLRWEAEHRPAGALRAERIFAALADAGVRIDAPRQYLGMTARARYCAGGTTADGLAVAVCEYGSPAEAEAGRDFVEERYAAMNSYREIHVRGATTLTLAGARDVAARRAATAFSSL